VALGHIFSHFDNTKYSKLPEKKVNTGCPEEKKNQGAQEALGDGLGQPQKKIKEKTEITISGEKK
jgi:hypothetical protein